jgi:hypothetical protein
MEMAHMNGRGIFGFLLTLLAVGLLVGIGVGIYQMGVAQGIVDAGRFPAGAPVPAAGYGHRDGPGIFGLLFGLFFLFLIFGLLRAAFSRGQGWGHGYRPGSGWGPGWGKGFGPEGGPESWREQRDRRVEDWHRKLHETEGSGSSSSGGSGGSEGASGPSGSPAR